MFGPAAAAAATGVQVGAAIVASRWVVLDVGIVPLAFLRYAIGAACLLPFALTTRTRVRAADVVPIALLGVAQFAVVVVLLNYALELIPAARAALLFATTPLLAMILEAALDRRPLGLARAAAVILTIAGVATTLSEEPLGPSGGPTGWTADIAVLGSASCAALCGVLYRPFLQRYPPEAVSALAMLASVLVLAVTAALVGWPATAGDLSVSGWMVVVGIGLSSGIGYYLWLWALTREDTTEVTIFLALSPLTAAALGTLLLGDALSGRLALGVTLVVLGLWLARSGRDALTGANITARSWSCSSCTSTRSCPRARIHE